MKILTAITGNETSSELIASVGKTAPPLTVSGIALAGVSLQDWVLIVTLAYTVFQFGLAIRKAIRERKK